MTDLHSRAHPAGDRYRYAVTRGAAGACASRSHRVGGAALPGFNNCVGLSHIYLLALDMMRNAAYRSAVRGQVLALSGMLLFLGGCAGGVIDPAGPVAAGERIILLNALAIMLAIVVPTILATLAFAWWFRAGNARARYMPDWSYSGRVELLVWSVPALVVIFLAGVAWIGSHDLDPAKPLASKVAPINVQVVALDWKWLFIYPDLGVASVNRLVVPVGTPIAFRITSATVMNSFFVPQLGSQIYAMSGMEAKLHLEADRPGRYRGLSAHYSGKGFPGMTFTVDAGTPSQFVGWLAAAREKGRALDRAAYLDLTRDSENVAPYTYRAVAPGLFAAVVKDHGTTTAKRAIDGREQ